MLEKIHLIITIFLIFYVNNKLTNIEKATNTPDSIREAIKQVYQADVQAIKNLGDIASSMITEDGTLTLPYDVNITGNFNILPIGTIILWSGAKTAIPSGWKLCDGSGNTPDLRNRFVVGAGDDYDPDDTGGANSVTLTVAQMPTHNHGCSTGTAGNHNHTMETAGNHNHEQEGGQVETRYGREGHSTDWFGKGHIQAKNKLTQNAGDHTHVINNNGNHTHTCSTTNKGSSNSHENRPPYYALCYIMRVI